MTERLKLRNTFRLGLLGTFLIAALVLSALNVSALPYLFSGSTYRALFVDTGGLKTGGTVEVAGIASGEVTNIEIEGDAVAVSFSVDGKIALGSDTRVDIVTATVLGTKHLRVTPAGTGRIGPKDTIGVDHTSSPYQLTDVLGDLADTTERIDTDQLADSMRVLTSTLQQTPDDLKAALDGVSRLSTTIASRDDSLRRLLATAQQVTGVLSSRSDQVNTLIVDANTVLNELNIRRAVIDRLFDNVTALATELTGLVADNRAQLAPTLASLQSVLDVLTANKANIGSAIEKLAPYVTELGEAVSSGPFFNSYIQNLIPGQIIDPFIRAALGLPPPPGQNYTENPASIVNGAPR
jgi:phospholipid/cholesterol/gamma-HCH transport system substrate-binding protein